MRIRQAANTDLQEKTDQEDFLDAPQRVGQFGGPLMLGQHGAECQRAQLGAEAEPLEAVATRHQRQQQPQQHHQLLVATGIEQAEQQWAQQGQGKYSQSPGRRQVASRQAHDRQGDQVLNDQHAYRHPPVKRAQFALALQHLGRQYGAGERQGHGQQQCLLPDQIENQQDRREENQTGNGEMQQAAADHLAPHQIAHFQLQAHGKQQ